MKALVLAGGYPQIALIQELKSRGITVVLADYNKEPVAKKYADIFYQESTQDPDMMAHIAKKENVDFLITVSSEQAIKTVARVSEQLGLPCYANLDTIQKVTSKSYMKKVFEEYGIPNAKHVVLQLDDELPDEEFAYPVIVKPTDCSGSTGVRKVWNRQELAEAVADGKALSKSGTVIIEEFVNGVELSVDAFVIDGKSKVLAVTRSDKIADEERFVIYRGSFPAMDNMDDVMPEVQSIVQRITEAFELKTCPLLVQMIYSGGRLYVLEFSARNGGSAKYLLSQKASGFNLIKGIVDITLGIKPDVENLQGENKYVTNEYLYCRPGLFDHLEGFEEQKRDGVISEYFQFKWKKAEADSITSSGDRMAGFTIQADTKQEMNRKHNLAMETIRIVDVNGEDMLRRDLVEELYPMEMGE